MSRLTSQKIPRCPTCKGRCQDTDEDALKSQSRCVLVEANKFTRESTKNELAEKVKAWGNAAPPQGLSSSRYTINLIALEEAKALMNGSIVLEEEREFASITALSEEETIDVSDDDDAQTISDDSSWNEKGIGRNVEKKKNS